MPTLEITTHLGCALACRFCPQDRLMKSYPKGDPRDLSLANFVRIVDKVPAHVRLDFSGMAEPWLNPHATDMVHAFERGRKVAIYTTLQGMSDDEADRLINAFGDRISPEMPWVIHLPDGDGNMTGWRPSPAYRATLGRFLAFQRDRPRAGLAMMTMSADGSVAEPLRDLIPDRLTPFVAISRAEKLDRTDFIPSALLTHVRHTDAALCASTPFFDHNTMPPNGDVVLCCMDYGRHHVVGNLLRQSYEEIHAGPAMGTIRVHAMTPANGDLLCRRCHSAVCLTQNGGTHWRLSGPTMWTEAPASEPTPPPRHGRLGFPGRVLHL
jgi:hypothetical protein